MTRPKSWTVTCIGIALGFIGLGLLWAHAGGWVTFGVLLVMWSENINRSN